MTRHNRRTLGHTKTEPIGNPVAWQRAQADGAEWDLPPLNMAQAQAELYQRLSWVQMAVAHVAAIATTAKLSVKALEGEKEVDIPNHAFEQLWRKPNPLQSRAEFVEAVLGFRAVAGNAYVWMNRTRPGTPPVEMWVIPPYSIRPVPDENLYLRGYIYEGPHGQEIPLELHEIAHFKRWNPNDPFVGLSAIEALATVSVGDMAMQKWNTNFFDKDHAKPPGALAYADPINDTDWGRMKADIAKNHGGVKRSLMLLRNVGKGGVEWINMAVSQKDMEFLQSRTFNRSEIFGLLAPGLDSILAINATEANAQAGRATLVELGVWPQLVALAEKITNDILPAYGPNLMAEFDDIRTTDQAMELQAQMAFERVGRIDEIRERYYQLEPIGDERGNLLIAEITAGKAGQPDVQPDRVEAQAAPTPEVPLPEAADAATEETPDPTAKAEDLARFRRWASKRRNPDPDAFKSDVLSYEDKAAVLYDILTGDADSDTMPPFTLTTGPLTPEWVTAAKAMILQLDPDDDEAEQKIRMEIERQFERELSQAMTAQLNNAIPEGMTPETAHEAVRRLQADDQRVKDVLRRRLQQSADLGVSVAVDQFETIGLGIDWTLANQAAADWVNRYTFELVRGIQQTSVTRLQTAVNQWVTNGDPLPALVKELKPTFGKRRAKTIAQTETTRAYSEANRIAYQESGVVSKVEWRAANDELVCPICGPLHHTQAPLATGWAGVGLTGFPPAHVNCRCWHVPVIAEAADVEPVEAGPRRNLSPDVEGLDPSKVNDWFGRGQFEADGYVMSTDIEKQKQEIAKMLAQKTGASPIDTSRFVHQWADSSNDNNLQSLEIQRIAADEFGTTLSPWQKTKLQKVMGNRDFALRDISDDLQSRQREIAMSDYIQRPFEVKEALSEHGQPLNHLRKVIPQAESESLTRSALRSIYETTQAELKESGIDEVVLYRGIKLPERLAVGESVMIEANALESWTVSKDIALRFAGDRGNIITARVPASRIFSTARTGFGCLNEYEFVVMSSPFDDIVKVIQ